MMQVWFLFKIIETVVGTICMLYHTYGFMDNEPLPHILLFCGTFFGFTLLSLVGAIAIAVSNAPSSFIECVTNSCASMMYFIASIASMQYAEKDQHLMYLSDFEEPLHEFFAYCRAQSISALLAGAIHLLHTILAFDALLDARTTSELNEFYDDSDSDFDLNESTHLRLYFLGKYIEKKLRQNTWFDNLCSRKNPPILVFSGVRKYRESQMSADEYRRKSVYVKPIDKLKRISTATVMDKHEKLKESQSLRFQVADPKKNEDDPPTDHSSSKSEIQMEKVEFGHPSVAKKKVETITPEVSEGDGEPSDADRGILKKTEGIADQKALKLTEPEVDEKPSTSKKTKSEPETETKMTKKEEPEADDKNMIDEGASTYVTPTASTTFTQKKDKDKENKEDPKDESPPPSPPPPPPPPTPPPPPPPPPPSPV